MSSRKSFPVVRRLLWAAAGWPLSRIRYARKANPYKAFKKLEGWSRINATTADKAEDVLLLPIRVSPTSNLIEGIVGAGLRLDGYRVHALLDGGSLRYSENSNFGKSWFTANALSAYEQAQFCKAYGLSPLFYDRCIDHGRLSQERAILTGLTYDQLAAYEFEGVKVGMHAKSGLMRYLRQETVDVPENTALLREFVLTGVKTALAVKGALKLVPFKYAFLSHAIYSTWGVAADTLIKAGVTITVWGRGYVGGNLILGRDKSYILESIDETMDEIRTLTAGRDGAGQDMMAYFEDKARPGSKVDLVSYYNDADSSQATSASQIAKMAEGYKAVLGVFPNIPWDGTLFSGSPYTPTLRAFAQKIIEAAEKFPDIKIIVRCHPAESQRSGNNTREAFSSFFPPETVEGLPNLSILEPRSKISSYDLMPFCDAALTFGTTFALELAVRGIPVLQTGFFNLSNKDILYEVGSDEQFYGLLEKIRDKTLRMSDSMTENARTYADYHVNMRHVKDDMVKIENYNFIEYRFDNVAELAGNGLKSCATIKDLVLGKIQKAVNPYA